MTHDLEIIQRGKPTESHPTPLLFVHGAWHGAWCWDVNFLRYFAERGYAAHAVSLRGHGESGGSIRGARIRDYVADAAQAAAQIEAETGVRPVVIGHSMGGLVTQKYLEKHDASAGVLVASMPVGGGLPTLLRVLLHFPLETLAVTLTGNTLHLLRSLSHIRWLFFSDDLPIKRLRSHRYRLTRESFAAMLEMFFLVRPRPQKVHTPLLVLGAKNDRLVRPRQVRRTARAYDAPLMIVPDMAHDMMLEMSWEAAAERIVDWLGELSL